MFDAGDFQLRLQKKHGIDIEYPYDITYQKAGSTTRGKRLVKNSYGQYLLFLLGE